MQVYKVKFSDFFNIFFTFQQPLSCSPQNKAGKDEEYVFACDIGNPLSGNSEAKFGFHLTGTKVDATDETVEIKMFANR